jgi:hypothetical protein
MNHTCYVIGCSTVVDSSLLMCRNHWSMVPDYLQDLIYQTYQPGQEKNKTPSKVWLKYAKQAIAHVKSAEKNSE